MDVYLYCYVATILWGGPPGRPLEFGHLVIGSVPSLTLGAGTAVKPRASARGFVEQAFRLCRTDALGVCLARSHECERGGDGHTQAVGLPPDLTKDADRTLFVRGDALL